MVCENLWKSWDVIIFEFLCVFIKRFLVRMFVIFLIVEVGLFVIFLVLFLMVIFIFVLVFLFGMGKMFNELIYLVCLFKWVDAVCIIFWNKLVVIFDMVIFL